MIHQSVGWDSGGRGDWRAVMEIFKTIDHWFVIELPGEQTPRITACYYVDVTAFTNEAPRLPPHSSRGALLLIPFTMINIAVCDPIHPTVFRFLRCSQNLGVMLHFSYNLGICKTNQIGFVAVIILYYSNRWEKKKLARTYLMYIKILLNLWSCFPVYSIVYNSVWCQSRYHCNLWSYIRCFC